MSMLKSAGTLILPLALGGCVSLGEYNDRVAQVKNLQGDVAGLEETLERSETARRGLKFELKESQEKLVRLAEEHEALKAKSLTAAAGTGAGGPVVDGEREAFARELEALRSQLAAAEGRITQLTTALSAREEAAKKAPALQAAFGEREDEIREVTKALRLFQAQVAKLQKGTADLALKRETTEEKEDAFAAIRTRLRGEIDKGEVGVQVYRDKLIVTMKEQVLFPSGSARISASGRRTLNRVAKILQRVNTHQILVEGHTDSLPVSRASARRYPTNWDLAAARAATVVTYLEKKGKIASKQLALAGYGCNLPAAANDCDKNRRLNRRIEIALVPLEQARLAPPGQKVAMN